MRPFVVRTGIVVTLVTGLFGGSLFAADPPSRIKDFERSPEFEYLITSAEKKEWKKVKSDAEAEKFIRLFWAKRDPDLKTPVNEFKARFDTSVKESDEIFSLANKRGALTERGKLYILVGRPKSISRKEGTKPIPTPPPFGSSAATEVNAPGTSLGEALMTFTYESDQLPAWAKIKSLVAQFAVESTSDNLLGPGEVRRLETAAPLVALVNPDLKEAPVYKSSEELAAEERAAAQAQAAAAAEANKGPVLSPPTREALEGILAKEPHGALTLHPIAFGNQQTRLMTQLYLSGASAPKPEGLKLAVLIKKKDGTDAVRREEPVELQKTKSGFFIDRAFPLDAGEYDVAVALLGPAGEMAASARGAAKVEAFAEGFGSSPLLLAYEYTPTATAKPDDAFVFSNGKFVSKANEKLDGVGDGLFWVVRLYNPAVDPATKQIRLKKTVTVRKKGGAAMDSPQPPDEPIPAPEIKDATQKIVLDLGGAIVDEKLADYFAEENTVKVVVTDTVSGQKVELTAPFRVDVSSKKKK